MAPNKSLWYNINIAWCFLGFDCAVKIEDLKIWVNVCNNWFWLEKIKPVFKRNEVLRYAT